MARASQILKRLEADPKAADSLPLFAAVAEPDTAFSPEPADPVGARILAVLADIDPDTLTPREALDILYRLKAEGKNT